MLALLFVLAQVVPGSPFGGGGGLSSPVTTPFTFTNTVTISKSSQALVFTGSPSPYIELPAGGLLFWGSSAGGRFGSATSQTPDTMVLGTGSLGNSVVMIEDAQQSVDFAHAQQTHPTLFIQSTNDSPVTQYLGASVHGLQTELFKTLTESAATSAVRIPVAAGASTGGKIVYTVVASDGTDMQSRSSFIRFAVVNKAGTETCGMSNNAGTADASITETEDGNAVALSAGTLTYAITCDTTPANAVDIQFNAVSSLTQTTLQVYYSVVITGPGSPLLQ